MKTSEIAKRIEDGLQAQGLGIQELEVENCYHHATARVKLEVFVAEESDE